MTGSEHAAAYAIYDLQRAINDLQELRMNNETADMILRDHRVIRNCSEWLSALSDDIEKAVHREAAE